MGRQGVKDPCNPETRYLAKASYTQLFLISVLPMAVCHTCLQKCQLPSCLSCTAGSALDTGTLTSPPLTLVSNLGTCVHQVLPFDSSQDAFSSFVFLAYRHKYEFLHSGMTPDIRITIPPRRIGILLDYENCRLSFFNADIAQHLHTFNSHFQHYVHPCFALETPGILRIHTGITTPPWTALL